MLYNVGNRGREEAEILHFLLALIHFHFLFTYCLCKGRMTGVADSSSPSCLSSGGFSVTSAPRLASAQDTPHVSGKSPTQHSTRDRRQDFYPEVQRWQWITQAAGKSVTLAAWMSWHFAGGQEPAWYNSLETLASASFPAWNRPQGEVKNTVYLFCLAVPRNTFSKNDRPAGRELHCSGIVKQV